MPSSIIANSMSMRTYLHHGDEFLAVH